MNLLLALLTGCGAAFAAMTLPGMLNMTVVSKYLLCGKKRTHTFIYGILLTLTLQAAVGMFGAHYLSINPGVINTLKTWAVPAFFLLAIYFVVRGIKSRNSTREERRESRRDGNHFLQGMSLTAMNMLSVPYYYLICSWYFVDGRAGEPVLQVLFLLGLIGSAWFLLTTYARFAPWIDEKASLLTRNLNFVISGMLMILALTQTFRMMY